MLKIIKFWSMIYFVKVEVRVFLFVSSFKPLTIVFSVVFEEGLFLKGVTVVEASNSLPL